MILDKDGVIERADEPAAALKLLEKAPVVDFKSKRLGRCVEIGTIDKQGDLGVTAHHLKLTI
jgi:hypothetical protein